MIYKVPIARNKITIKVNVSAIRSMAVQILKSNFDTTVKNKYGNITITIGNSNSNK